MNQWTFKYNYTPEPEIENDTFVCEAETEEQAWALFDKATDHLDNVEVDSHESIPVEEVPYEDPNQLKLFEQEGLDARN